MKNLASKLAVPAAVVLLALLALLPTAIQLTQIYNPSNPYAPEVSASCNGETPILKVLDENVKVNSWVEIVHNRVAETKYTQTKGSGMGIDQVAEVGGYTVTVRAVTDPKLDSMPEDGQVLSIQFETVEVYSPGN